MLCMALLIFQAFPLTSEPLPHSVDTPRRRFRRQREASDDQAAHQTARCRRKEPR